MSAEPIQIRQMVETDLAIGDELRTLAGWNQTLQDWRRWWSYQPEGCFIGEWNGRGVGTATTTSYGIETAWIGMVLVHPEFRRRGIASALMNRCLEYLAHVQAVRLDATPLGKPLYEELGFMDEWPLTRWERKADQPLPRMQADFEDLPAIRRYSPADRGQVHFLDRNAFGLSRERLLDLLVEQSQSVLVLRRNREPISGFAMLREGSRADYLGPIAADPNSDVTLLISRAIAAAGHRPLYWDIPDQNELAVEIAKRHGFQAQRPLVRMCRGKNDWPGDPRSYFGIADPAVG